jgi:hypothetical protein
MIPHASSESEPSPSRSPRPAPEGDARAARWIALKRYETPGPEYFDRFLEEFRERQRSELLRLSVGTLLRDRIRAWGDGRVPDLRWGGALAAAVALLAVFVVTAPGRRGGGGPGIMAGQEVPVAAATLAEASLIREF